MSANVLAIIPARAGSKGIPGKNALRFLAVGLSPVQLAIQCAKVAGIPCVVTSDNKVALQQASDSCYATVLHRDRALAQDETPMRAVVDDVLMRVDGARDEIILLLQPTQPLRQAKHLHEAVALMKHAKLDVLSVVSVTEAISPDKLWRDEYGGQLIPWAWNVERRQDARRAFRADGTVYAWRRCDGYWDWPCTPLIIPASETCELDTLEDWANAERRLSALAVTG